MYVPRAVCNIPKPFIAMLLTVPLVWTGAWLNNHVTTRCDAYLTTPFLALGIILFLLYLAFIPYIFFGLDSEERAKFFTRSYFCLPLVPHVVLLGYTIFALVVSGGGADHSTKWLRNRVSDTHYWRHTKACLTSSHNNICLPLMVYQYDSYQDFHSRHFSSLQNGCCNPPKECNLTHISLTTVWTRPTNTSSIINSNNQDCKKWSNDPYTLCLDCQSCKDNFIIDLKTKWKKAAIVNLSMLISFVVLHVLFDCGDDPGVEPSASE